jgi:toxin ParE1/3/4
VLIRGTVEAAADLDKIVEYISNARPETALRVARRIFEAIESLEAFPRRGRKGKVAGTHEFVLSPLPYIVVYRIERDAAVILRVYHGAQNRP